MKEVSALLLLHDFCNLDIHWKSKVFSNVLKDSWKIFENLESKLRGFAVMTCFFDGPISIAKEIELQITASSSS